MRRVFEEIYRLTGVPDFLGLSSIAALVLSLSERIPGLLWPARQGHIIRCP